ncbi:glutathione S-transferase [Shewanella psychropiezotolerans]|uniref:Glutathione S-transferase n=1 Tax=Shewanella psychropiezotolerans TaxID=2593655 RepID=A0ABX5X177_9GAMM|nr:MULTISPECIES: glutathione S-transferase [Shewanella]MPY21272.1 glutathione S-transferase [Shewanella sp. YLB-07]MPY22059.1 glutathione S-transferase [Shewanella sp. YLB-07]QDO85079.1 glutathione S-transferase [Shewanella psychropiezotolerans]
MSQLPLPTLYSLQHCPYAMRARLGLLLAKQKVMLKAVVTKNKSQEMLAFSPKGTVPVLVLEDVIEDRGTSVSGIEVKVKVEAESANKRKPPRIIDESVDIMLWALNINDPDDLLLSQTPEALPIMLEFISYNDKVFKPLLEQYKDAKRYHKDTEADLRTECESFIQALELRLSQHQYLMGDNLSLLDFALLPFVRQFARVDRHWYLQSPYPLLRQWLKDHLNRPLFSRMMKKFPLYSETGEAYPFG